MCLNLKLSLVTDKYTYRARTRRRRAQSVRLAKGMRAGWKNECLPTLLALADSLFWTSPESRGWKLWHNHMLLFRKLYCALKPITIAANDLLLGRLLRIKNRHAASFATKRQFANNEPLRGDPSFLFLRSFYSFRIYRKKNGGVWRNVGEQNKFAQTFNSIAPSW